MRRYFHTLLFRVWLDLIEFGYYYNLRWPDDESMEIFHMLKSKFVLYSRFRSNVSSDDNVSQHQDHQVQDIYSNEGNGFTLITWYSYSEFEVNK